MGSTAVLAPWRERVTILDELAGPVVVACSGGPDSLALLAIAADHAALEPVAVHVDHGLRPDSAAEADRVAAAATALGTGFRSTRVEVTPGGNLAARARDARYAALEAVRLELDAAVILVGHTADDQAETVVTNLLRGSGAAGLGGMAPRRGRIVRPLLGLRRHDTEAVCSALRLEPLRDPTNEDLTRQRAWVRHELLPALGQRTGRDVVAILARQADVLRRESEYLDELARAAWPVDAGPEGTPARVLARLPDVLARRAVRQWLGAPPPSSDEVERVLAVARGTVRATELVGGRRVLRRRGRLLMTGPGSVTP